MTRNRLAEETSPYLLQHAGNPVHWYPWGETALADAREEGRPILLSIGYAACHWCHVMAHESFEDPAIAQVMNEHFVNVKIDREERPDLDAIYQQALALMGEQGGWPLTMFCTPDGKPFWGGTYFPPTARYGRPGFPDLLRHIARIYREEHEKVETNTAAILDAIGQIARPAPGAAIAPAEIEQAVRAIAGAVDTRHGGFGDAPKFPQAPILKLLWTVGREAGIEAACEAVTLTLDRMAQGGIYDHLGGGFARYSTDAAWLVPHFEKMLYDNAQLIELYTMAWRATGSPLYAARIEETVGWLEREMTDAGGAFHATLDADSEGEEGRFYVWDEAEIREALGADYELFAAAYDVRPGGNWEGRTILNRSGLNRSGLNRSGDPALGDAATEARLARCREILFERRSRRVRPGLDDKVLADWNGLAIAALADAAMAFGREDWLAAAARAYAFIVDTMGAANGEGRLRLAHSWRGGTARPVTTLDDHAQMARAALALFEASGNVSYIETAQSMVADLEARFADEEGRAFFFTPEDAADVIARTRPGFDNATPSGNGAMVEVYARLFHLTGEDRFRARATALLEAFSGEARKNPFGFGTLLSGARLLEGAVQVAIVGTPGDAATRRLVDAAWRAPAPLRIVRVTAPGAALPAAHPAAGKGQAEGVATAYVCRGPVCSLPVTAPEALAQELAA